MNFKSVVFGFVVACGLGLAACGNNNDSSAEVGMEEGSADVVKFDEDVENALVDGRLPLGEGSSVATTFDVSPPTSVSGSSTTYADNFVTRSEATSATTQSFAIRVSEKEQSPSTKKVVPTTAAPAPVPVPATTAVRYRGGKPAAYHNIAGGATSPSSCLEINSDFVDGMKDEVKYNLIVEQLFWHCLLRAEVIYDDNGWVKKLKSGESFVAVRSQIYNSPEAKCLRGSYQCAVKLDQVFKCNFSTAELQYEQQKERLHSFCPEVKVTIKK